MYAENHEQSLQQVVSIENPVYQSYMGRYFIGQSPLLRFGCGGYAYGVLLNPRNSCVNLYLSVVTVTNTSGFSVKSRMYVNSSIPRGLFEVKEVVPANLAFMPPPRHAVRFLAGEFIDGDNADGVKIFTRMVTPYSTLANEKNGKIIIPPGGNLATVLVPPGQEIIKADIAYGWWEERI